MTILDANGNVEKTWTINSGDPVGPDCCSAYYDWFASQEFDVLVFDNVSLTQDVPVTPVPEPGDHDAGVPWGDGTGAAAVPISSAPEPTGKLPKIVPIGDNVPGSAKSG